MDSDGALCQKGNEEATGVIELRTKLQTLEENEALVTKIEVWINTHRRKLFRSKK